MMSVGTQRAITAVLTFLVFPLTGAHSVLGVATAAGNKLVSILLLKPYENGSNNGAVGLVSFPSGHHVGSEIYPFGRTPPNSPILCSGTSGMSTKRFA